MLKRALEALSPAKRHPYAVKPFRAASYSHSSVNRSMRGGYLPHTGAKQIEKAKRLGMEPNFPNGLPRSGPIVVKV